jgi:hypothetical protein
MIARQEVPQLRKPPALKSLTVRLVERLFAVLVSPSKAVQKALTAEPRHAQLIPMPHKTQLAVMWMLPTPERWETSVA